MSTKKVMLGTNPKCSDPSHVFLDKLVYLIAAVGPFSSLPQIIEIWFKDHSAEGVSLLTWLMFMLMSVVWLWYGITRRDKPLIISNALWILTDLAVIAGAIRYDGDWL